MNLRLLMQFSDMQDLALCRYGALMTPITTHVSNVLKLRGREAQGREPLDLCFTDFEKLEISEVKRIRTWLEGQISEFCSKVRFWNVEERRMHNRAFHYLCIPALCYKTS